MSRQGAAAMPCSTKKHAAAVARKAAPPAWLCMLRVAGRRSWASVCLVPAVRCGEAAADAYIMSIVYTHDLQHC